MTETTKPKASNVGAASLILASGTMVSRILGFVRVIILAQTIGVVGSVGADAFANANSIPSAVYSIIAGGMLNVVLVPQVVRASKDPDGGQSYINRLVTIGIIVLGVLGVASTLAAPFLSQLFAVGLTGEQLALVVAFAYWCLPQVFFYGLYQLLGEVLNARGSFGPFTWAQVVNNIVNIAMLVLFSVMFGADPNGSRTVADWTPEMIAFLGGTSTLAVAVQALICFAFWKRVGLTFRFDTRFRGIGLRKTGSLASWTLGMLLLIQVVLVIETNVANLAFGVSASVAALQNALLIFILPHSIVSMSIATAYFPRMSEAAAEGDERRLVRYFSESSRSSALIIVFSMVGMMVISTTFARVFEPHASGTFALAATLTAFLIGLPSYSIGLMLQRMFYVYEDAKTLFWIFAATTPIHIFAMALASLLPTEHIVIALALAEAFTWTLRDVVFIVILRRRLGRLDGRRILRSHALFLVAAVVAGAPGLAVMWFLGAFSADGWALASTMNALLGCALGGTVMAITYVAAVALLRVREFDAVKEFVGARAGRLLARSRG